MTLQEYLTITGYTLDMVYDKFKLIVSPNKERYENMLKYKGKIPRALALHELPIYQVLNMYENDENAGTFFDWFVLTDADDNDVKFVKRSV